MPGNPVRILFRDPDMSEATRQALTASFGLDKPLYTQFVLYLVNTFQGNLGVSFEFRRPVLDILIERLSNTIPLLGIATVIAIVVGVFLGAIAAWKRGSTLDFSAMIFSLITWACPTFWLAMMAVVLFAGILPVAGTVTPGAIYGSTTDFVSDYITHLALPAGTLALLILGQFSLIVRSTMLNDLKQDYVLTARAKGLPERTILFKHVLRNTMLPVTTLIALNIGSIVGGAIQIEVIFSWPGIGEAIWDALLARDYPVLQGAFLVIVVCMVASSFMADVLYAYLDPRIRRK
jgi:peptide/nickel transport system permease protein